MTDIFDVLSEKGIEYKTTNNPSEIVMKCTSGLHEDIHPSLSFNLDKNIFKCWSCDFEGGVIKFLESIGVTQKLHIESKQEYKILKLKRKLQRIKNVDNIKLPKTINNIAWEFNGVNKDTLIEFKAFTTTDMKLENYICIPVYQFERLKFIDARKRIDKELGPKYLRKPANVSVSDVLFPVDKIDKVNHIILVEGIYDMLNLWQFGIRNTLCIFGTQNFNQNKVDILDKIGIHKVTILMDGDEAGRLATNKISNLLEKNNILTIKKYLKEGLDPGNLTAQQIQYYLGEKN